MIDSQILQGIIGGAYVLSMALTAANRYVLGCVVALISVPAWWLESEGLWGFRTVAIIMTVVYGLGILGRLPLRNRKQRVVEEDEHAQRPGAI